MIAPSVCRRQKKGPTRARVQQSRERHISVEVKNYSLHEQKRTGCRRQEKKKENENQKETLTKKINLFLSFFVL